MRPAAALFLASLGLATLPLAAQAPRTASRVEAAVPFRPGESLTYDVTYSSYLVAGTAVTTVQNKRAASGAYQIVVEGRPIPMLANLYRLYYRMDSLLDSVTLLPHRTSFYAEEGSNKRTTITEFDRTARKASFEVRAETSGRLEFEIPPQVQDGLTGLYVLRTMALKPGSTITLPIADEGTVYSVRANVTGTERLRVPLGEFNASVLKMTITDPAGQSAASNTAVWISNDARRFPIRMQADLPVGSFVLLLRQASP